MNTIGQRLKEARKAKGLSQTAAGSLLGVSGPRVYDVETGGDLKVSTLRRYARTYGIDAETLGSWILETSEGEQ